MDAEADARLPLSLENSRNSQESGASTSSSRGTARQARTSPRSRGYRIFPESMKVGIELINAITLWFPSPHVSECAHQMPVAVLANNSRCAFILDLQTSELLQEIKFAENMNRVVISPDGEMLVAIGDDPFLYVYQRKADNTLDTKEAEGLENHLWAFVCRIQLKSQKESDKASKNRGSFAASFSQSGKFLAVGTQYGVISVFLASFLTDPDYDPLLRTFTTSRPGNHEPLDGAVRAMAFSPYPYDLLAWTEASGRVGIADVRDGFFSRQLLDIDSRANGVERIYISDRNTETEARLRSLRTDLSLRTYSTPDYLGIDFDRQFGGGISPRQFAQELHDRHQLPLTADELEVLQAHRAARMQRDASRDATSDVPDMLANLNVRPQGLRSRVVRDEIDLRSRQQALPAAIRDVATTDRSAASFRAFIDRQNQDRDRRASRNNLGTASSRLEAANNRAEGEGEASTSRRDHISAWSQDHGRALETPTTDEPVPNLISSSAEFRDAIYRTRYSMEPPQPYDRPRRLEDRSAWLHGINGATWTNGGPSGGSTSVSGQRSIRTSGTWRDSQRAADELDHLIARAEEDNPALRRHTPADPGDTMGLSWSVDGSTL